MVKDFMAKKDGDLAIWLGNFQTQLAALGQILVFHRLKLRPVPPPARKLLLRSALLKPKRI